jgi:hypothetical protein
LFGREGGDWRWVTVERRERGGKEKGRSFFGGVFFFSCDQWRS